jgi:hypothetical protein
MILKLTSITLSEIDTINFFCCFKNCGYWKLTTIAIFI